MRFSIRSAARTVLPALALASALASSVPVHADQVAGRLDRPPTDPPRTELNWVACDDLPETECAALEVPLDPAQPDGAQLKLRLGRMPAADPNHTTGPLLLIPGGPGAGLAETFGAYRAAFHIDELQREHDVVSFDPRGVGQSHPVRCAADLLAAVPSDGIRGEAEFTSLAQANAAFARSCFEATGGLMAHLSAMDTAADIELIRQAVGQHDGLVAYAGSYGTNYAGAYLERYGDHVQALVLDGVFDHSVDLATMSARNALGVEDAFGRFVQWCATDGACALHGQDVEAVFDAVASAHPAARPLVAQLMAAGRDPRLGWPAIAELLAQTAQGEPAALERFAASVAATTSGTTAGQDPSLVAGRLGLLRGVLCSDFPPEPDYAPLGALSSAVAAEAPRFGALKFWDIGDASACVGWPNDATNPPHHLRVGPHPNVLVTNNLHDPATPLISALAVWRQIPEASLLIADADGHQALPVSRCAFEAQLRFLDGPASTPRFTTCAS